MIVPILRGGLGNQMFQIANAFAYAKRNKFAYGINCNFSIVESQGYNVQRYRNNIFSNLPFTDFQPQLIYKEPTFNFVSIPPKDNMYLDGFFQTEKYFKEYSNDVKLLFEFPKEIKNNVDIFINTLQRPIVGIHVRRGDYIKASYHHKVIRADYYIKAANFVKGYQAVVCTDDWDSVKKEMVFPNSVGSPFTDELSDMYLLSQCDAVIMCNSSFSWWGAFLGMDKRIVVAPRIWFAEGGPKEYQDIYREGWILI